MNPLPGASLGPTAKIGAGPKSKSRLGAAAALIGTGFVALFLIVGEDDGQVSSAPIFDTEMGLESYDSDPGGMAPGELIGGYQKPSAGMPGDSLGMFAGANPVEKTSDAPASVDEPEKKKDWVAALEGVVKKKRKKKPRGIAARLKAMAAGWGRSGGGSGASMSSGLSKPSSKGFKLARRGGAGSAPRLAGDKDFRSTYGDGSTRVGAKRKKVSGASGFMARAAAGARSMFGMGPKTGFSEGAGTGGPGPLLSPLTDANTTDIADIPEAEGKPVDPASDDSDSNGSEKPKFDPTQLINQGMSSAMSGITGNTGATNAGNQQAAQSGIPTTVSAQGLYGDANAQKALGQGLGRADTYLQANPPKYTGDSMLQSVSTARSQVGQIKPFDPTKINATITAAKAPLPPVDNLTSGPELTLGVGRIDGDLSRASGMVVSARSALADTQATNAAFTQTLGGATSALETNTQAAVTFSERSVKHKGDLLTAATDLEGIGTQLRTLEQQYPNATTEARPAIVQQAQGIISPFTPRATTLASTSVQLETDASGLATTARNTQTTQLNNIRTATTRLNTSMGTLQTNINNLKGELARTAGSLAGQEVGTSLATLRSNGNTIVTQLEASYTALHTSRTELYKRSNNVYKGHLALNESWKKPS
jgi:hypothetical protein